MDALAFLDKSAKAKRQPIYALSGDEDFLKRLCRDAIRDLVLGEADPEYALTVYSGEKLEFSTVRNDLETLPFLAPARLVIVETADTFVTAHRPALEKYAEKPSTIGVLVLDVKSFPETTKLAKMISDAGKIACKSPPDYKIGDWCISWAKKRLGKRLDADAATMLVERVGLHLGILASELDKLAIAVGDRPEIGPKDVESFAGRNREADVFRILDAIGRNQPGEAIGVLEQLFEEGEDPLAILGPMTYQLRKLAAVGRHHIEGHALGTALDAAGVPKWPKAREQANREIAHLGMRRLQSVTEWLAELNFGLKGGNPLPPQIQMERLIAILARSRAPNRVS
jgi:DNA polymerase-3 subunit delta